MVNEIIPKIVSNWKNKELSYSTELFNENNWTKYSELTRDSVSEYYVFGISDHGSFCLVVLVNDLIELLIYERILKYSYDKNIQVYPRNSTHEELFQLSTVQGGVIDYDNLVAIYEVYDEMRKLYVDAQ